MEIKPTKTHRVFLVPLDDTPRPWLIRALGGSEPFPKTYKAPRRKSKIVVKILVSKGEPIPGWLQIAKIQPLPSSMMPKV